MTCVPSRPPDLPVFTPFDTLAIVGVGMMGGSLGLEVRARGLARRVAGIDRNPEALDLAIRRGAIDLAATEPASVLSEADGIVFAAPVCAIPTLMETFAASIGPDAFVTDLGSTKRDIDAAGRRWFGMRYVGGHPMAGAPEGGIGAALPNLFEGAAWVISRDRSLTVSDDPAAARLAGLAVALGARPIVLDAVLHDRLVAYVSHLPHLLSFSYAGLIADLPEADLAHCLAGGSFRDLTRVASADPQFWREIFRNNLDFLLEAVGGFERQLRALKATLEVDQTSV